MSAPLTPLDLAHDDMQRGGDAERLKFYELILDSEVVLWLAQPAEGDALSPQILPMEGTDFVMIFDDDARLAHAAGQTVDRATLPGRALVSMIAGQGLGLALNLGEAPSAILIGPEGVSWMARIMAQASTRPDQISAQSRSARPLSIEQTDLPQVVLARLAEKLGLSLGQADAAILVKAGYEDGSVGHILAFVGAQPVAQAALIEAANQAIAFSGMSEDTVLDVTLVAAGSEMAARLRRTGHVLPMERASPVARKASAAPGSDPAVPPKLK